MRGLVCALSMILFLWFKSWMSKMYMQRNPHLVELCQQENIGKAFTMEIHMQINIQTTQSQGGIQSPVKYSSADRESPGWAGVLLKLTAKVHSKGQLEQIKKWHMHTNTHTHTHTYIRQTEATTTLCTQLSKQVGAVWTNLPWAAGRESQKRSLGLSPSFLVHADHLAPFTSTSDLSV